MGKARRAKRARLVPAATSAAPAAVADAHAARPGWLTPVLAGTLVAAAAFRIVYLLQYRATSVFFDAPLLDAAVYDGWARRIAAGEWAPAEPFFFSPGYAYALGLFYAAFGRSLLAVYAVQLVLGLVSLVLVHRLTTLTFGRRAGDVAAVLAALYAPLPFLETKLMSASLALVLLLGALSVLAGGMARGERWRPALAGVLLGATSLIRPETLLLGMFLLLWLWRAWPRAAGNGGPPFAALASLMLGWGLAIAPVALHNVRYGAGTSLIASHGALTFYQSNNPRARGLYTFLREEGFSGSPETEVEEERAIVGKALGHPPSRSEMSAYWYGRGLEFMRDQPGAFVRLLGMKLLRFVGSYEYSTEYMIPVERDTTWLLWLPFVPFGLLVALALPTVLRLFGRRADPGAALNPTGWLLVLVALGTLATVLVFHVSSRYRLPAVPSLIAFASATLVGMGNAFRAGRAREAWLTAALVGVVFLAVHFEKDASSVHQEANTHYNAGNIWKDRKDYARATAEYRRAIAMDPSRYLFFFNLAIVLREQREYAAAAEAYGEAAARRADLFPPRAFQGLMLETVGDWAGARAAYEKAARINPDDFEIHLRLGRAAAQLGDRETAIRHLDRAIELKPDSPLARAERARL
jgi:4-amino-4-deoxy-L-arabinose transferase-like glycosyltransferase